MAARTINRRRRRRKKQEPREVSHARHRFNTGERRTVSKRKWLGYWGLDPAGRQAGQVGLEERSQVTGQEWQAGQ
eukprot:12241218-Heterocapsa_arctica.AAC.1